MTAQLQNWQICLLRYKKNSTNKKGKQEIILEVSKIQVEDKSQNRLLPPENFVILYYQTIRILYFSSQ